MGTRFLNLLKPRRLCDRGDHPINAVVIEGFACPTTTLKAIADRVVYEYFRCPTCGKAWPQIEVCREPVFSLTLSDAGVSELRRNGFTLIAQSERKCTAEEVEKALDELPLIELRRQEAVLTDKEIRSGRS
jgi:predicted RNA-binding Zn-ribbon protein involved in translation (DUF1610 family)